MTPSPGEPAATHGPFPSTLWTLGLSAGERHTESAQHALSQLCELYWKPVYLYIRRRGYPPEQAQDLTQEFFRVLLEKDVLADADQSRGRFRSFLFAAIKHFLSNQLDHARAKKRGGDRAFLSLDFETAEGHYRLDPPDNVTPETVFEWRWATSLLEQTLRRVEKESATPHFERLKVFLVGDPADGGYAAVAAALGMSETAVKVAVHRLRKRYRNALRAEIRATVADDSQVEDELRFLLSVLQSTPNAM
jgi:RNA polymerase sigma-70 factor (ECF subfamily)